MAFQKTFKALSDPTRRDILELLKSGSRSAGDIGNHFDLTGATVSHHLAILKEADLVRDKKAGKFVYYELNLSVFEELMAWVTKFTGEKK
ncbi:autorepressor SdpR family transcription factor [Caproicibacterium sp. NSD3]